MTREPSEIEMSELDAERLARDGYVVTQQLMSATELNRLITETADEVGVIRGLRFTNS